jgi:hypothetical protein
MNDKRQHERIAFPGEVKIMHPDFGSIIGRTRDLSDGGLFLFVENNPGLGVGAQVTVQAQDISGEAPLVEATVVRVEAGGVALKYESVPDSASGRG